MLIAAATFEATETEDRSYGLVEEGTVEVTIGRETRRVRARRVTMKGESHRSSEIHAYEMVGRYLTSAKPWPASLTQTRWADGKVTETAIFGRDDRSGRFNKLNAVSFA